MKNSTQPLHCCECGKFIENVQNETHGIVCASTMCEKCHSEYVQEAWEEMPWLSRKA